MQCQRSLLLFVVVSRQSGEDIVLGFKSTQFDAVLQCLHPPLRAEGRTIGIKGPSLAKELIGRLSIPHRCLVSDHPTGSSRSIKHTLRASQNLKLRKTADMSSRKKIPQAIGSIGNTNTIDHYLSVGSWKPAEDRSPGISNQAGRRETLHARNDVERIKGAIPLHSHQIHRSHHPDRRSAIFAIRFEFLPKHGHWFQFFNLLLGGCTTEETNKCEPGLGPVFCHSLLFLQRPRTPQGRVDDHLQAGDLTYPASLPDSQWRDRSVLQRRSTFTGFPIYFLPVRRASRKSPGFPRTPES